MSPTTVFAVVDSSSLDFASLDFDPALSHDDARELSLRRCAIRRCGFQPSGPNRFSPYLSDRWCDALNRKKSPENCAGALATPMHSATTRTAAALSQSETRLFARMCECTSAFAGKSSFRIRGVLGTKADVIKTSARQKVSPAVPQPSFGSCYRRYFFVVRWQEN